MRPFEIVLVLGELLTLVALAVPPLRERGWAPAIAVAALALAVAQPLLEGPRWQLFPAYGLSLVLLLAAWLQRRHPKPASALARVAAGAGIAVAGLAMVAAAALPALLPVFEFPEPTGPYGIGTVTYHWVDADRPELFTAAPDDHRELVVQVWYPARKDPASSRAPYAEGTDFASVARLVHLPEFFFDHLKYVTTNAEPSAPVAESGTRFPLVIFSTGRGGYRASNTFQVEELVSHGYVVAGIDHPYTATGVRFPDGRVARLDQRVADSVIDESIVDDAFMLDVFDYLGADAVFTLNQFTALDKVDPQGVLIGRLDLEHVGIFGPSLGGITAAEACRLDPRFGACLIMDVAMPPDVVASGLTQPAMWISRGPEIMRREGWPESAIRLHQTTMRAVFEAPGGDSYLVLLPGMFHTDMTDVPYVVPPPLGAAIGTSGPMDWHRTHGIINAYTLAFFDRYLKGAAAPLLDGPSPQFPEVAFESRR